MARNLIQKILLGLVLITCLIVGVKKFIFSKFEKTNVRNKNLEVRSKISNSRMTYGRLLEYIEMGWVKQVDLYENNRKAIVQASSPELGNRLQPIRVEIPIGASQLIQKLKEYNINFDAHPIPEPNLFLTILSNLLIPLIFIGGLIFFFKNSINFSSSGLMNIGKSWAKSDKRPDINITFDTIAGIDEAKAEFEEIVSFLKEPDKYTCVGAKIPKGVLLIGPPGTGKTLLAKAIANEANVPFFSVAGSEFIEMFVGIGAARIRDLFKKASKKTPCIVFIDEIDAIGRQRGVGIGGGNDEREQTLNQLLTEMDGFKENKGVIIVGATNRVDILDPALLRPGRFDRQITIDLPDRLGRIGILKVHAENKLLDEDVSLVKLATRTPGFSGADLANLLNESAILATRYKKQIITKKEINEAADRIIGGITGTNIEDNKNKKLIAYHEVGHAIVGSVLAEHDAVEKITLIPQGKAKGLTWFIPNEETPVFISRSELFTRITAILGGRVTEQIVFGEPEITTGAGNDLQQITSIARQMVSRYGMSKLGPIAVEDDNNEQIFGYTPDSEYNETLANRVDNEIYEIINYCENNAKRIILDNRIIIDLAVEKLLDVEILDGEEFRKLIKNYTMLTTKV